MEHVGYRSFLSFKWHHHASIGRESLLFVGTPEQLGLTRGAKHGEGCAASPVKSGVSSNAKLRDDLLSRLPTITASWKGPEHLKPQLICHGWGQPEQVIDGHLYDRVAKTQCKPFRFMDDTIMTEIYFAGPHPAIKDTVSTAPLIAHSHSRWALPFVADDGMSHGFDYLLSPAKVVDPDKCKLWWLPAEEI